MRRFGEIVRDARTHAGLTQKELAKNVPTDHTYISKLEKGVCLPPRKLALGLADALGINEAEERIKFLSAAGVLSDEDLREFQLVRVGSTVGKQALTQSPSAQQLPAVAGITEAVLQQMIQLLQALTTAIPQFTTAVGQFMTAGAQLQAQVLALLQMNTATLTPSVVSHTDPDPQPSGEQGHGKAPAGSMRNALAVELEGRLQRIHDERMRRAEGSIDWDIPNVSSHHLPTGAKQDEEYTQIHEEEGSLLVVMYGLQGMTLLPGHYEKRAQPILEGERGPAATAFMASALKRVERRRNAFEKYVRKYEYRHILPIKALDFYVDEGYHRVNDWTYLFEVDPAPQEQCAADIRHIIDLLNTYDNYHLGLFTGADSEDEIFTRSFWELKAGETLVVEDLRRGEKIVKTKEPAYTAWFADWFNRLWKSKGMIIDKEEVIKRLERSALAAERLARASTFP